MSILSILKVWSRPLLPRNKELAIFLDMTLQGVVDLKRKLKTKCKLKTQTIKCTRLILLQCRTNIYSNNTHITPDIHEKCQNKKVPALTWG